MIVAKDPKIVIAKDGEWATFSWRAPAGSGWALLVFSILMVIGWLYMSGTPLENGRPRSLVDNVAVFAITFPFCLWLGYGGLVTILNWTVVKADRDTITQFDGPLPVRKRLSIEAAGIQQFIVVPSVEPRAKIFAVDGNDVAHILATLPNLIAAHQVVYELHQFYGIEERPVAGFGRVLNASPPA